MLIQRGLNDEIIKEFNLGYAPDEDILLNYLSQKDFKQDLLRDSGLFVVDRNGNFHDRFKGRLMFPINDISGQTIAFSGRLVQQRNDLPKIFKYVLKVRFFIKAQLYLI